MTKREIFHVYLQSTFHSDVGKLSKEFDVIPRGLIDLSILANQQLNSNENWSLTGLVMNLVCC
jgi:hypothetical protein